ncbi:uncharacterized protein LOC110097737 [Dendrobium catenatum]|nr:uncharacterized protein LOC110097737 [Dendrobium catenatum]
MTLSALHNGEVFTGRGLNQEISLWCPGEARWGSHYESLIRLITMFSSVVHVLEIVLEDDISSEQRGEAFALLDSIQYFDFSFCLHLMKDILGITAELSDALQRKDQDIVNAMSLVQISKIRLQDMRDNKWDAFITRVSLFCVEHKIITPDLNDKWIARGRSRRGHQEMTNLHHYRVDIFYTVLDMQLQELNNHFTEANTELLLCIACLNPSNLFSAFNKDKLIKLANLYPSDFTSSDLMILDNQLETYITDMKLDVQFSLLKDIGSLVEKMIQSRKEILYPLVFRLLKLALVLPVATAGVERAFSAMAIIKNRLRNGIGDQWMNDTLIAYVEKEILDCIVNDVIIHLFQNMKNRMYKL